MRGNGGGLSASRARRASVEKELGSPSRKADPRAVKAECREILRKRGDLRSDKEVELLSGYVQGFEFFAHFPRDHLREICRVAYFTECGANETLFDQGSIALSFHVVFEGSVWVRVRSANPATGESSFTNVAVLEEGTAFGELGLMDDGDHVRKAGIVAREHSTFLSLRKREYRRFVGPFHEQQTQKRVEVRRSLCPCSRTIAHTDPFPRRFSCCARCRCSVATCTRGARRRCGRSRAC